MWVIWKFQTKWFGLYCSEFIILLGHLLHNPMQKSLAWVWLFMVDLWSWSQFEFGPVLRTPVRNRLNYPQSPIRTWRINISWAIDKTCLKAFRLSPGVRSWPSNNSGKIFSNRAVASSDSCCGVLPPARRRTRQVAAWPMIEAVGLAGLEM